jgi:hypothetical protein
MIQLHNQQFCHSNNFPPKFSYLYFPKISKLSFFRFEMENQIQEKAAAETEPIITMEQMQQPQQELELVADRILQVEFRPTAHLAKGFMMGIHVAASMGLYNLVQVNQRDNLPWEGSMPLNP